ncbi:hypothetical protein KY347_03765 [Candidatus Woesearchaeota archaeon]|nr:hypothetical protein [Candidatus Woesearchaeota archaeon]
MKTAKAFAPGNISGVFVIRREKKAEKSGSLGMGFTVNKGVLVTIKRIGNYKKSNIKLIKNKNKKIIKNKNLIYFNNKKINFPTVNSVIEKLANEKFYVGIRSELPLGCGFGVSGASALASAYALNRLLNLKKSKKELAMIAHIAEVEKGTGLGDVTNQYYGGLLVKYLPSCTFRVEKFPIKNKKIYCRYFSSIKTKKIISDSKIKGRINSAGIRALKKFKLLNRKNASLGSLIKISKEFAANSGLLADKKVIGLIKKIEKNNGNASMIMLGNAVFSDKYFKGSRQLIIKDKGAFVV